MSGSDERLPPIAYLAMGAAILITVVFVFWMLASVPHSVPPTMNAPPAEAPGAQGVPARSAAARPGVDAVLTAGGVTVMRRLPAMRFRLEPGQTLDARLPPGPFEGTFTVRFDPGRVRMARLGADLQGGQLMIMEDERVLLSSYAGADAEEVWPTFDVAPSEFGSDLAEVTFTYTARGDGPLALRAMWQPVDRLDPQPLPGGGALLEDDPVARGMMLVETRGCASCHESDDPELQAQLAAYPSPRLGVEGGVVARPGWLRAWITDPRAVEPDARMPVLGHGGTLSDHEIEDLVHYVASLGTAVQADGPAPSASLVATGLVAYHRVGCFACHGPLETPSTVAAAGPTPASAGGAPTAGLPALLRAYTPLGDVGAKRTVAELAAFLADPLASRPSGLMPALALEPVDAQAIAAYLVSRDADTPPTALESADHGFVLDDARAERGRALFARVGCANCHDTAPLHAPVTPTLTAPALETLGGTGGCLGDAPAPGLPSYGLSATEREEVYAFLASLPERRSVDVPLDELARAITTLDCTQCHAYEADVGPESGTLPYFGTIGEADLGDEGRLPPTLTDAGGRLTTSWMHGVLAEGTRARPYLAVGMPQFGARAADRLPALLAAASGTTGRLDDAPAFSLDNAAHGRTLVGAGAFNCIQCHEIAGHPSTGTPGPDLALAPGRLHYRAFARWLQDPALVRPGTRMPSFYVGGISPVMDVLGGRAEDQIGAIWSYLSQGDTLPLPDGLTDPAGFELVVDDAPVVFRTFMQDAGVRAIACGYPEQVHCAFDADRCQLAIAWQGRFLNAQGAWGARGGSETNPDEIAWIAPSSPVLALGGAAQATTYRFRGYELDDAGRPTFLYELVGPETTVRVRECPEPIRSDRGAALTRRFELTGPAHAEVDLTPGALPVEGASLEPQPTADEPAGYVLRLDEDGRGMFTLEVRW